jgi:hypothetical protein
LLGDLDPDIGISWAQVGSYSTHVQHENGAITASFRHLGEAHALPPINAVNLPRRMPA